MRPAEELALKKTMQLHTECCNIRSFNIEQPRKVEWTDPN